VFFEKDHVIDSVTTGSAPASQPPAPAPAPSA